MSAIALMGGPPIGSAFVLFVWSTELARMKRAGRYLGAYLEPRINIALRPENAVTCDYVVYEQWLAGRVPPLRRSAKPRSLRLGHLLITVFLAFLAWSSFTVGALRFDERAKIARHCASAVQPDDPICPQLKARRLSTRSAQTQKANIFLRSWRFGLPWQAKALEFWLTVLICLVVPASLGVLTWFQSHKEFTVDDLPDLSGYNSYEGLPVSYQRTATLFL
jgi:hypothetical protein